MVHGFSENEDGFGSRIATPNVDLGKTHHCRPWRRPQIVTLTWRTQQKHTKKMLSSEGRSTTRPEIHGSLCPEQNNLKQRKWNRRSRTNLCLPGMTDAEQLRKKEWLRIPRQASQALRRLYHMLGHKPKAVMRQVLKAGGAPPEQLAGVELFHCDKCDEAVPPLQLHPVKAPARYTFNHEVLIDVLQAKDAAVERFFLSLDRAQRHVVSCRRHGSTRRRNPIVA